MTQERISPLRERMMEDMRSRYTHRVAISNSRFVSADADTVAFRWKDYRGSAPVGGRIVR